jgi:hypothetical protein
MSGSPNCGSWPPWVPAVPMGYSLQVILVNGSSNSRFRGGRSVSMSVVGLISCELITALHTRSEFTLMPPALADVDGNAEDRRGGGATNTKE